MGGYKKLKSHDFFTGIDWDHLPEQKPPDMLPYLPANSTNPEPCWSKQRVSWSYSGTSTNGPLLATVTLLKQPFL